MSQSIPHRLQVIEAFKSALATELTALERVSSVTREEVTSDETRSEGKYDTRSTEASYLARGQAIRIADLRQLVAWAATLTAVPPSKELVCLGSLVVAESTTEALYFLAPAGGTRIVIEDHTIRVVSPKSPLGKALIGAEVDDEVQFESPTGIQTLCLLHVG